MARSSTSAKQLTSLLDGSVAPIYVVDERRRIVFCNAACGQWLGISPQDLLGQRCDYHSQPLASPSAAIAAAICPPPEAFAGSDLRTVVSYAAADGRVLSRQVHFIPLPEADQLGASVLAVAATEELVAELDAPRQDGSDIDATALHELVGRFRREQAARYGLESLFGNSPAMIRARAQIMLAASSDAAVLITGPPGTGKQHVAKAIHYGRANDSPRALVPLNCASLSADLLNSTLQAALAHDSSQTASGRETLLLSDVDCLPDDAQAELARLLALGPAAKRIISTAAHRLTGPPAGPTFRLDLACSLSTLVIELPALEDRLEDLPVLAQLFLEQENARGGKQVGGFSQDALDRLAGYRWPRNLDELAIVVREAHQRAESAQIAADGLPPVIQHSVHAALYPRRADEPIVLEEFLARVETELIERAMRRAKGNKSKAAKLLGLTRPRLYRRLVQLGLEKERQPRQ